MQDTYTEVTTESWSSRLGGSIKGIGFGLILFVAAFPLLFWNEGRAVKTARSLEEGASAVVSVSSERVSPANDRRLVHLSGQATTEEVLSDPVLGVKVNAIRLVRKVEMYQWTERKESVTEKNLGGSTTTKTTYHYEPEWSERLVSSAGFARRAGHENPASKHFRGHIIESRSENAGRVKVGAFRLSPALVQQIAGERPLALSPAVLEAVPHDIRSMARISGDTLYLGSDASRPRVGDLRIGLRAVKPTGVSIIAAQIGDGLGAYQTKAGRPIEILSMGPVSADAMFASEVEKNTAITWGLRLLGLLIMTIGLSAVFRPLSVLADVVPFIGNLVGAGTGVASGLLAGTLSLVTIAIAWLFYRPLLGIGLLALGGAVFVVLPILTRRRKSREIPAAATGGGPPPPPTVAPASPPPSPPPPFAG